MPRVKNALDEQIRSSIKEANQHAENFKLSRSREDLDEAIRLGTIAVELSEASEKGTASNLILRRLGFYRLSRHENTGSLEDLLQCILTWRKALSACPKGHQHRAEVLYNLSHALQTRYDLLDSASDLVEAIEMIRESKELRAPDDRQSCLTNLAFSLRKRFYLTKSMDVLDEVIALDMEALGLFPVGHGQRRRALTTIALDLRRRFDRSHVIEDLNEAIRYDREALHFPPNGLTDRAIAFVNLANGLRLRFTATKDRGDLAEAIRLLRKAIRMYPPTHKDRPWALALLARCLWYQQPRDQCDAEIFQLLKEGAERKIFPLDYSLECARLWVSYATKVTHHSFTEAADVATSLLSRYLAIHPTIALKYNALTGKSNYLSIPGDAASHALNTGNPEKAVELLEAGRSLIWSELRRFRMPASSLTGLSKSLIDEFEHVCVELRKVSTAEVQSANGARTDRRLTTASTTDSLCVPIDTIQDRRKRLTDSFDALLDRIRATPGLESFLKPLPFVKLREAALEGPIIVVNASKHGSHAIIVLHDQEPVSICLDHAFFAQMTNAYQQCQDGRKILHEARDSKGFERKLRPVLTQLWDLVVEKVVDELRRLEIPEGSRIWWCPTSFLMALPFHAAGSKSTGYLIDFYTSSYVPTLMSLIESRKRPRHDATKRLLVVSQNASSIPRVSAELDAMRGLSPGPNFLDGDDVGSSKVVLQSLQSHSWVHFSCHGTIHPQKPFESSLSLSSSTKITLRDIVKCNLPNAEFAFLAACHSAEQTEGSLQDENLHLAAAMQFIGFRSVIGTMWDMADKDGSRVAKEFYELARTDGELDFRKTAYAIREVTRKMKEEKKMKLERWVNYVHVGA